MNKNYIIDKKVLFSVANKTLSAIDGRTVKLNTPTGQILEVLILHSGELIPQRDIYHMAWGEDGANVTPNTLYQNISLLRKALSDIGLNASMVQTIRGKGFIFSATAEEAPATPLIEDAGSRPVDAVDA
ncbi:winged helix-turn-helix domain-containing protein, partial [Aeromonas hydrophila]|uniref:winged helix-turn-helix domain-containing protein n=1 Tax=Aeromonas hydrophila TaxID=644 RepID=UPI00159EF81F